ncbi:junctional adhesion molecule A-like isoform 2-T2 [Macrochelys suwanniensis]
MLSDFCFFPAIEIPCAAYVSQSGTPRVEWQFEKGSSIVLFYYNSKFTVPPSKPVAKVPTSVTVGNKAVLTCMETDGSPPPTFQWYRDNVMMPSNPKISEKFRNSYTLDTKTGVLTIEPVTSFDTGDYFCEAQNNIGTAQKSEAIHLEARNVISHKDMKALVASGKARIIDVRLPGEVANGHIANSVNIPVAEVEEALKMDPETFKMKYGMDKPRMDDENLIFYCQRGRRGAQTTEIAMTLGYVKARNYAGGYEEWSEKEVKWE